MTSEQTCPKCPKCGAAQCDIPNGFACGTYWCWDEWPNLVQRWNESDRCKLNVAKQANATLTQQLSTLTAERDEAKNQAAIIAECLYERHFKHESPDWQVSDEPVTVVLQVSNMVAGVEDRLTAARAELAECKAKLAEVTGELAKHQRWERNREESKASLNAQVPCGHPAEYKAASEEGGYLCWECEWMSMKIVVEALAAISEMDGDVAMPRFLAARQLAIDTLTNENANRKN